MPAYLKIILTILVATLTVVLFRYEVRIGNQPVQFYVAGVGIVMILALWLFPEAGKRPGE